MSSKIGNPFAKMNKKNSGSVYSMVSCSDLTPGSLDVWVDLPEAIKYDPALAPFKQMYEQKHGTGQDQETADEERSLNKKLPEVEKEVDKQSNNKDIENRLEQLSPDDDKSAPARRKRLDSSLRVIKLSVLVASWVLLTVSLLMNREKTDIVLHTAVSAGEVKEYFLKATNEEFRVAISLTGPFADPSTNQTTSLQLWLHRTSKYKDDQDSPAWVINLQPDDVIDFAPSASEDKVLFMDKEPVANELATNETDDVEQLLEDGRNESKIFLRISSGSGSPVPLTVNCRRDSLSQQQGLVYATLLLATLYILIIFEVVNRTLAALLSSSLGVAVLALVGERPSLPELVSWLDVETLLLLFSMMILVAIVAETGLFDYLAVFTFEVTKGKLWPLIYLLCIITAVLSTFLDNVTTILLISPVTIRLCEVMDLDPVPILMLMAMYSNIGGTATPVGDPPNVIVASNKAVIRAGINFTNFTAHMSLGILLVCVQTSLQIRFMFRDTNKLRVRVPKQIQDLRHQITIWRRAADSLPRLSNGVNVVRERLERKITKLTKNLDKCKKESSKRACSKETFVTTLEELKAKYKIRDKNLLIKSSVAIAFVVIVFFMHSIPELNRVSLGWTALLGAILLLILADRADLEPILHRVEWSTLLFFASLFVLMEALSKLGLISYIGDLLEILIFKVDEQFRMAVALMLILWASGAISAFVDNIPLTTMMVRVVVAIGNNPALDLPMAPLIWALLFGACLGGNGTLIGASANVVCAGVAEQHGYRFTFMQFFRIGFPIMIGHLCVSSVYLLMCHCVFEWH